MGQHGISWDHEASQEKRREMRGLRNLLMVEIDLAIVVSGTKKEPKTDPRMVIQNGKQRIN
jgi:hypothetical protein